MSPRGTNAAVLTPFRSTGDARPLWLVEIATGIASPTHLRVTNHARSLTFGGNTYTARPFKPGEQSVSVESNADGTTIEVADLDSAIAGYIASGATFQNAAVELYFTDVAATGGATSYGYLGSYLVESYTQNDGRVTFHCRPLLAVFGIEIPIRLMTRQDYPGLPVED